MPFIQIRSYPKDRETVLRTIERVNQVFIEEWGCPPEALTFSHEEIPKEEWQEKVTKPIMEPLGDKILIRNGVRKY